MEESRTVDGGGLLKEGEPDEISRLKLSIFSGCGGARRGERRKDEGGRKQHSGRQGRGVRR